MCWSQLSTKFKEERENIIKNKTSCRRLWLFYAISPWLVCLVVTREFQTIFFKLLDFLGSTALIDIGGRVKPHNWCYELSMIQKTKTSWCLKWRPAINLNWPSSFQTCKSVNHVMREDYYVMLAPQLHGEKSCYNKKRGKSCVWLKPYAF